MSNLRARTPSLTVRAAIAAHPVLAFVALALAISFFVGLPLQMVLLSWAAPANGWFALYAARLPVLMGPTLAAVIVAQSLSGRQGLVRLLRSMQPRAAQWPYWLASAVLALALTALALWCVSGLQPSGLAEQWPRLLAHAGLQIALVGCLEELGWRGFLLPRLLERHTPLRATLLTAAAWYAWHLPALLSSAQLALGLGIMTLALSFLFTVLYRASRSAFPCAVAHGCVNAPLFFLAELAPSVDQARVLLVAGLLYALLAAVAARPLLGVRRELQGPW